MTDKAVAPAVHPPAPLPVKLTPAAVRAAGIESATMAEAEQRLSIADLAGALGKSKRLKHAWDKGRRLRDISALAITPISQEDASQQLGMGERGLGRLCARDREVRDIWERGRVTLRVEIQKGLLKNAAAGKPDALAAIEKILHGRFGGAGGMAVDFAALSPIRMAEATGLPRQTILRWHKNHGLPRNRNGTYSLPSFIEWYIKWERDKVTGGQEAIGLNPLQAEKARRERRENDEAEGRLVPISLHVEELKRRAHCLAGLLSPFRAKEWAQNFCGKAEAELEQPIVAAFRSVLDAYRSLSPDIPVSDQARMRIEEGLALLMKVE